MPVMCLANSQAAAQSYNIPRSALSNGPPIRLIRCVHQLELDSAN